MNRFARNAKPSASRKRRSLRALLSVVAASGILFSAQIAAACDYCESSYEGGCDSCDAAGPGFVAPKLKMPSPGKAIFKTLDAVAGGIEKVMGFDKCSVGGGGCDASCDDGCDAALMNDLMMPMPPAYTPHTTSPHAYSVSPGPAPMMAAPRTVHPAPIVSAPRVPAAPMGTQPRVHMSQPTIVSPYSEPYQTAPSTNAREQYNDFNSLPPESSNLAPIEDAPIERFPETETTPRMTQPRMTQPRITQPRATQPRATQPRATQPRATQPRATQPRATQPRMPVPDKSPNPPSDEGSLFDSLGEDPFGNDEVRLPSPYRAVHPSNYRLPKPQATQSGFQLRGPQASRTRQPNNLKPAQQRSVAMMRQANGRSVVQTQHAAHQHAAHQHAAHQHATHNHTSHRQHASASRSTNFRSTNFRSTGTKRAAATRSSSVSNQARQVSHQQAAKRRTATLQHQHGQPRLKPVPQPRVANGQRHATPHYSSYGHTTNR